MSMKLDYKPVITTTERDGKTALWVNMPNGETWNIWDTKSPPTEETMRVIASAFSRGFEARILLEQELQKVVMVKTEKEAREFQK